MKFRPRFTVRALLIAVTLLCVFAGWNVHIVRQRATFLNYLKTAGAKITPAASANIPQAPWHKDRLPIIWKLFGAEPIDSIEIWAHYCSARDAQTLAEWFPEATIVWGNNMDDVEPKRRYINVPEN